MAGRRSQVGAAPVTLHVRAGRRGAPGLPGGDGGGALRAGGLPGAVQDRQLPHPKLPRARVAGAAGGERAGSAQAARARASWLASPESSGGRASPEGPRRSPQSPSRPISFPAALYPGARPSPPSARSPHRPPPARARWGRPARQIVVRGVAPADEDMKYASPPPPELTHTHPTPLSHPPPLSLSFHAVLPPPRSAPPPRAQAARDRRAAGGDGGEGER